MLQARWAMIAVGLVACVHRRDLGIHDLDGALAFIEAVHPRPSQVDLVAARAAVRVEAERRDLRTSPSFTDRVRGATLTVGALGDAHVVVGTPPRDVDGVVPLLPVVLDGRVYVDAFVHDVPKGTILRALEGRPVTAWLTDLEAMTSVDGGRSDARRAQAVRSFASLMYRYLGPRTVWTIETEAPDGTVQTWTEPGVNLADARNLATTRVSAPQWGPPSPGPWPTWTRVDEQTAHLRLTGFGTREVDTWVSMLDAGFSDLEGSETVVVDLRGNAGGFRDLGVAVAR
jgi:hypothetical protein